MTNAEKIVSMTNNNDRAEFLWFYAPRFTTCEFDPEIKVKDELENMKLWLEKEAEKESV